MGPTYRCLGTEQIGRPHLYRRRTERKSGDDTPRIGNSAGGNDGQIDGIRQLGMRAIVPSIATRYDKLAANYLAFIKLASIRLWLRNYESTP